jgi:hypothetical protein
MHVTAYELMIRPDSSSKHSSQFLKLLGLMAVVGIAHNS